MFAALFLATTCFASEQPLTLDGKYDCGGNELGTGISFKCEMIIKKTGQTYASSAVCNDGNAYTGTGIYNEKIRAIASVFINPKKADETGVTVTYIKDDESMTIDWTYLNKTSIGHSACVKSHL